MKTTPEPIIEHIDVQHDFSITEIGEIARRAALANQRVQELEEKKKQITKDYAAQVEAAQAELNSLSTKISNGYEMRETECVVTLDPKNSSKDYHIKKSGVFARRAEMTKNDFQISMKFEKEKAKEEKERGVGANVGEAVEKATETATATPVGDLDEEEVQSCVEVIRSEQKASVSLLQRRLRLSYAKAAAIMDELQNRGIVGPANGAEPREILIDLGPANTTAATAE